MQIFRFWIFNLLNSLKSFFIDIYLKAQCLSNKRPKSCEIAKQSCEATKFYMLSIKLKTNFSTRKSALKINKLQLVEINLLVSFNYSIT